MASSAASDAILGAIPHRAPFLFVDRIVERSERGIVTEWKVDPEADFLRGHYPGHPIVPGVLLCESAFQSGALLCALLGERAGRALSGPGAPGAAQHSHGGQSAPSDGEGRGGPAGDPCGDGARGDARKSARPAASAGAVPVLARIGEARFRRKVLPGETVRCRVTLEEEAGSARRLAAHVTSAGETVLQVSFTVALAEAS